MRVESPIPCATDIPSANAAVNPHASSHASPPRLVGQSLAGVPDSSCVQNAGRICWLDDRSAALSLERSRGEESPAAVPVANLTVGGPPSSGEIIGTRSVGGVHAGVATGWSGPAARYRERPVQCDRSPPLCQTRAG